MTVVRRPSFLEAVPDWGHDDGASAWLRRTFDSARQLAPCGAEAADDFTEFRDLGLRAAAGPLGWHAVSSWRRFTLGLFAADLACYETSGDQVTFDRLSYVVSRFPEGFRLWWREAADGGWLPVGYTGWYPVSATTFSRLESGDPALADRLIPPARDAAERPFIYVFNYSAALSSRRSSLSRALMQRLADDLAAADPAGLAAITVSEDGMRIAERFRMKLRAELDLGGLSEWVYAVRFGS